MAQSIITQAGDTLQMTHRFVLLQKDRTQISLCSK